MEQPQSLREVFLSITELRNGRWTPKRVTPQAIIETDSRLISEIQFTLAPCDFTWIPDGPFLLVPGTYFLVPPPLELLGCRGYPEPFRGPYLQVSPTYFERDGDWLTSLENVELSDGDPLVPHGNLMLNQTILGLTPDRFRISYPQYMSYFDKLRVKSIGSVLLDPNPSGDTIPITVGTFSDWFYADKGRTFFVRPELVELGPPPGGEVYDTNAGAPVRRMFYEQVVDGFREQQHLIVAERGAGARRRIPETGRSEYPIELLFSTFYHPLVCAFTKRLYTHGLTALLARETQFDVGGLDFAKTYLPTSIVDPKYPTERVDFDRDGSYSLYNWELFFHAPLMVATRLSKNQRFEEAMQWFHYIFDPTGGHDKDPVTGLPAPAPQKYWITKPFFERQETGPGGYLQGRIENL